MTTHDYDTHRCDGSLAADCSMRRLPVGGDPRYQKPWMEPDGKWRLYVKDVDDEWDYVFMRRVATIRFCPFCGTELV